MLSEMKIDNAVNGIGDREAGDELVGRAQRRRAADGAGAAGAEDAQQHEIYEEDATPQKKKMYCLRKRQKELDEGQEDQVLMRLKAHLEATQ